MTIYVMSTELAGQSVFIVGATLFLGHLLKVRRAIFEDWRSARSGVTGSGRGDAGAARRTPTVAHSEVR